jgi:hypothetical protein
MREHFRISLRGLLFLPVVVAIVVQVAIAWPSYGAVIGPSCFLAALVASVLLFFVRRSAWANTAFRCSIAGLLFIALFYASIGPACWAMARYSTWTMRNISVQKAYNYCYVPVATNIVFAPEPIHEASVRYVAWWMPKGAQFWEHGDGIGWEVPNYSYTMVHYGDSRNRPLRKF